MAKKNEFGDMVRRKRLEMNLSQRALARRIGMSPTYIYYVESGKNPNAASGEFQPSVEAVDAIAKALRVDLDEARLAAGYAPIHPPERRKPQTVAELVERLAELGVDIEFTPDVHRASPDDLDKVLKIIELGLQITLRDINTNAAPRSLSPDVHASRK